jgi:putative membrane protein
MLSALIAFVHHLGAFTLVSAIAAEFLLTRGEISLLNARRLLTVDLILGIAAATVLTAGVLRVLFFEKGLDYYLHNLAFLAKMGLFVAVGALSIMPTRRFLSWRAAIARGEAPTIEARSIRAIRQIIHLELAGAVLILLCAALMAKGLG